MRDYTGVPFQSIPQPDHPDFVPRLRNIVSQIDFYLLDLNRGMSRIQQGQVPDGSGNPISTFDPSILNDYLFLPGRTGGQIVHAIDASPGVTVSGATPLSSTIGSIGAPLFRLSNEGQPLLDFRPYRFAAGVTGEELAITNASGSGIPVNFPSDDGTSALRIASTTNRTYIQCGLKDAGGNVTNAKITIGAAGARVGTELATELQRMTLANFGTTEAGGTVIPAQSTRVTINVQGSAMTGADVTARPNSLYVWGANDTFAASATANGTVEKLAGVVVIERGSVANTNLARNFLELRTDSGAANLGSSMLGLCGTPSTNNGKVRFYHSGVFSGAITTQATGNGTVTIEDTTQIPVIEFQPLVRWSDNVACTNLKLGQTTATAMICGGGYNVLSRLGISTSAVVMGPVGSNLMPAPSASRLLTVVSGTTVLGGFASAGQYFLTAGASAGKVYTSDASGVGSWGASTALTINESQITRDSAVYGKLSADDTITGRWSFAPAVTSVPGTTFTAPGGTPSTYEITRHVDNLGGTVGGFRNDGLFSIAFIMKDAGTGNFGTLTPAGITTDGTTWYLPDLGAATLDTIVVTDLSQFLQAKVIKSGTVTTSCKFGSTAGATRVLQISTSGSGNFGGILQLPTMTASRTWTIGGDLPGMLSVVGSGANPPASGALGRVDLTAQAAAVAFTNLSSGTPAGLYRVSYDLETTTASATETSIQFQLGWTDHIGAVTATGAALSLAATGRDRGEIPLYLASGNITYAASAVGLTNARYALHVRAEYLG